MVGIVLAYAVAAVAPNMEAANALLPTYVTTCLYFGVPAQLLWFYLSLKGGPWMRSFRLGHMSGAYRSLSKSNELESRSITRGARTYVHPDFIPRVGMCYDVLLIWTLSCAHVAHFWRGSKIFEHWTLYFCIDFCKALILKNLHLLYFDSTLAFKYDTWKG